MWSELWQEVLRYFAMAMGRQEPDLAGPEKEPRMTTGDLMDHRDVRDAAPPWSEGLWLDASYHQAHPQRIGGSIVPRAIVVHTTDTLGGFQAMVRRLTTER